MSPDTLAQLVDVWPAFIVHRTAAGWHVCGLFPGGKRVSLLVFETEAEARKLEAELDALRVRHEEPLATGPARVQLPFVEEDEGTG